MKKREAKRPLFHKVDEATRQEEKVDSKGQFSKFFGMYKGVKVPWLLYILAFGYSIFSSFIQESRTGADTQIATGEFENFSVIAVWAGLYLLYYITSFGDLFTEFANHRLVNRVSASLWDKIVHLPLGYYDKQPSGRLVSRVTSDTSIATSPFALVLGLGSLGSLLALALDAMGKMNPTMTKWYVVCNAAVAVYMLFIARMYRKMGIIVNNRLSKFTAYLSERLANFRLIKASCSEDDERQTAMELVDLRFRGQLYYVLVHSLDVLGNTLANCVLVVVAFGIGGVLLHQGAVESGSILYSFYIYGSMISLCIYMVLYYLADIGNMLGRSAKFSEVLQEDSEDISKGSQIDIQDQDLTLENVAFSYDENIPVLNHVNCIIPKGKVTAIVGANGSGKSTLIKILDRLYPADGSIRFGDVDASTVALKSWRSMFGVVTQDANLFTGSLRDNICYGVDRVVSDEELQKVVRLAQLEDVVAALPGGVNGDIGPHGGRLSGGEQQRVAIARAMMKNPEYLLLDEATANLDARTETQIKQGLNELMKGRTTVMIAHNLSAIRGADHIIVIQNGQVVASGTHEDLLERCRYYKEFVDVHCIEEAD